MSHPYATLPPRAFWRSAVAEADRTRFPGLYVPRVAIGPDSRIATAGSCFAQHIARYLRGAGVTVLDAEPAPAIMPDALAQAHGYRLFSGRYGNVYTARQLRELLTDAMDGAVDPDLVWTTDEGRFLDALRPTVDPEGLDSAEEVRLMRAYHLERTARMLTEADVFIFTLGLTEAWEDTVAGRVLPVCPGVAGGRFDPARHVFRNFRVAEILDDLRAIHALLQRFRPGMALVLTVSPVPLTATASGEHVLTATSRSKAALRAAAAEFCDDTPGTDYVPSYEIVTHPASGGPWFAPNLRSVTEAGVEKVMGIFLAAHGLAELVAEAPSPLPEDEDEAEGEDDALICDELLLDAFARAGAPDDGRPR